MKYKAFYYWPQTACNNLCATNANQTGNFNNQKNLLCLLTFHLSICYTAFIIIFLSLECNLSMTSYDLSSTLYFEKSTQSIFHILIAFMLFTIDLANINFLFIICLLSNVKVQELGSDVSFLNIKLDSILFQISDFGEFLKLLCASVPSSIKGLLVTNHCKNLQKCLPSILNLMNAHYVLEFFILTIITITLFFNFSLSSQMKFDDFLQLHGV